MFDRILNGISEVFKWICILLTGCCAILIISSVLLRYIFNITFVQTEELITFLFISIVFFGSVYVMKTHQNVGVQLIPDMLPVQTRKIVYATIYAFCFIFQIWLTVISIKWIVGTATMRTAGLRMPVAYIYVVIPIGAFFSSLFSLSFFLHSIASNNHQLPENEEVKIC